VVKVSKRWNGQGIDPCVTLGRMLRLRRPADLRLIIAHFLVKQQQLFGHWNVDWCAAAITTRAWQRFNCSCARV
jgi:hypothetical protein